MGRKCIWLVGVRLDVGQVGRSLQGEWAGSVTKEASVQESYKGESKGEAVQRLEVLRTRELRRSTELKKNTGRSAKLIQSNE